MKSKKFICFFAVWMIIGSWSSMGIAAGIEAAKIADKDGKIFLTDIQGRKWRCFTTGRNALPMECRLAGPGDYIPKAPIT